MGLDTQCWRGILEYRLHASVFFSYIWVSFPVSTFPLCVLHVSTLFWEKNCVMLQTMWRTKFVISLDRTRKTRHCFCEEAPEQWHHRTHSMNFPKWIPVHWPVSTTCTLLGDRRAWQRWICPLSNMSTLQCQEGRHSTAWHQHRRRCNFKDHFLQPLPLHQVS